MSPRAGLTTDIVVETAMKIVDEEGIGHLTLLRIAEELGVRSPSLYEHVEGIEGLIRRLRLNGLILMGRQFQRAVMGVSGDDAIRKLADTFRLFAKKHPAVYSLTVESDVADSEEIRAAAGEILDAIYAVLRTYGLSEDKLVHATRYMRSVIHGFVSLEMSGGFGLKVSLDESFDLIKEIVVSNMKSWY
ncbi:MAG: WHG domain-containing protein [Candidatus Thermoplasmatota archaeon]|nr:WHG domain-containing protein [Candidatus Thermoplasmatota archaeon]